MGAGIEEAIDDHEVHLVGLEPLLEAPGHLPVPARIPAVVVDAHHPAPVAGPAGVGAQEAQQGVGEEAVGGLAVGEHEPQGEGPGLGRRLGGSVGHGRGGARGPGPTRRP